MLLAGQVSVSTFISGCLSQNDLSRQCGADIVYACVYLCYHVSKRTRSGGLLGHRSITRFLQTTVRMIRLDIKEGNMLEMKDERDSSG